MVKTKAKGVSAKVVALLSAAFVYFIFNDYSSLKSSSELQLSSSLLKLTTTCEPNVIYRRGGLPVLNHRNDIGDLLEARRFTHGAEVGVQRGGHAATILSKWKSCKSFILIDVWKPLDNYFDLANVDAKQQDEFFQTTKNNLKRWEDITTFHRMLSLEAVHLIPDQSLDFVYIDARHDYCGVLEDIKAYYPKVRPGGIITGHDFLYGNEVPKAFGNWTICGDGTVHHGSVRGAVEFFAAEKRLVVSATLHDGIVRSWMMQKPTIEECVSDQ